MLVNKSDDMRKALLGFPLLLCGFLLMVSACKKKAPIATEAPLPATTTVTSGELKMRISPNTTAVEIARLNRGEVVKIVQRSADSVQVGKLNAYWYKVTNASGLTGWVYGAHLAVESNDIDVKAASEEDEKKLKEELVGRWEVTKINGELTADFVTLKADGQIEFGTNRKGLQYGKYTVEIKDGYAYVTVTGIQKPQLTDLKAKMVGATLVFTGTMKDAEYKLSLADKDPEMYRDAAKKKAAEPAPPAAPGTP